jgi:hypothetical protein
MLSTQCTSILYSHHPQTGGLLAFQGQWLASDPLSIPTNTRAILCSSTVAVLLAVKLYLIRHLYHNHFRRRGEVLPSLLFILSGEPILLVLMGVVVIVIGVGVEAFRSSLSIALPVILTSMFIFGLNMYFLSHCQGG